jgi:hypothetical protein
MSSHGQMKFLQSQKIQLAALIADARQSDDIVAAMALQDRLDDVQAELEQLSRGDANTAEISLLFEGDPVSGSEAIDANFAAKALDAFQGLVTRLYASKGSDKLHAKGKIKGADYSSLNIRGVAKGSFGFVLEEKDARQTSVFKTPVREAIDEVMDLFEEFSQESEDDFLVDIDRINPRIFNAMGRFVKLLNANNAIMRAELPDRIISWKEEGVQRAYRRIAGSHVSIQDVSWVGTLIGLSPVSRTFEFRRDGEQAIVTGKFGSQISQDYLERIEGDEKVTLGSRFHASIEIGTLRKPDGTISVTYTVTDLKELGG